MSLYAQTSTATDPVTSPISLNLANANFDLSEGRQYEVGVKQQLLDGRAEYTLAYFDIQKDDMVTRLPGATVNTQIGQQSSDGIELTFRINPVDTLSIDFNAAFVDSQYDEFWSGATSLAGNTPAGIPETTMNLWVNWAPIAKLQLGAGARYVGDRFTNDANSAKLPEYTVFDASASWSLNPRATVVLRGRNLTDEEDYVLSEYTTDQWVFGEPRAYEVSFRYSF
jgi:iron complex outermembrane recepter protein